MSVTSNDECADGLALVALELDPREQVIWSGRPRSVGPLVLRSAPKAIMGLASLVPASIDRMKNYANSSVIGAPPWEMAIGRPVRSGSISWESTPRR